MRRKQAITRDINSSNMQYRTETDSKETDCGIHWTTKVRCKTMNAFPNTKTCALIFHWCRRKPTVGACGDILQDTYSRKSCKSQDNTETCLGSNRAANLSGCFLCNWTGGVHHKRPCKQSQESILQMQICDCHLNTCCGTNSAHPAGKQNLFTASIWPRRHKEKVSPHFPFCFLCSDPHSKTRYRWKLQLYDYKTFNVTIFTLIMD